jgi:hypothetical protein
MGSQTQIHSRTTFAGKNVSRAAVIAEIVVKNLHHIFLNFESNAGREFETPGRGHISATPFSVHHLFAWQCAKHFCPLFSLILTPTHFPRHIFFASFYHQLFRLSFQL